MITPSPRPVVVGVDGSASALHAVRWAAAEAERRHTGLRLVHVVSLMPPGYPRQTGHLGDHPDVLLDQGRQWLWEAADLARSVADAVEIETDIRDGTVAEVLREESETARLLVLGTRGLGGFAELLVGSIAVTLAAHAYCPVVVTRSSTMDSAAPVSGPVVVGVDGSPLSDSAIAFGFEAAAARGVPLRGVHAWLDIEMVGAWTPLPSVVDWAAIHANEERILGERLAGWQEKFPTVTVERVVVKDRPVRALLRQATDAQLVVVGSRGRGALAGIGLGSVSQSLLHHAPCPVAVIRPEKS